MEKVSWVRSEEGVHLAKPSIFSRDYERRIRRRRRKIIIITILVILVCAGIFINIKLRDTDFSKVRADIQAWIDSDKPKDEEEQVTDDETKEEKNTKEEQPKEPEKKYLELTLSTGIVKAEYTEQNNEKKFVAIEGATDIEYNISPSFKQIVIEEKNQDIKLFNVDGTMKDITKKSYVSQAGSIFAKEDILKNNPTYIWHSQVKFIDENRIAYVSQMPYFGNAAVNKYIWIYDLTNAKETALWNLAGPDTTLGTTDPTKGISAKINGVNYFINGDGVVTQ